MINTIFYFADTQAEYQDNWQKGEVKPHTICFAKDTKTIWRDGRRFSGLRQDEVDDEIHILTDDAIDNLKGGVRNLEFGLDTAVRAAAEEKIRLNGEISRIDGDVATVASNLTATAAAIRNEVRNGELYTSEGWDPKINAYLKTVGLWDYGTGDTQHVTKWSTLRQSVSDVSSEVNRVEAKADGYNNTLQSKINQEVTDRGEAVTTLSNTFAKSTKDLQGVIEWMYSGLHSGASADMSYAEIIAAGKNGASSAISDLRTSIETTSDGKYVAQSSLTSSVDSAISGIVNDVSGKYANTSVFSQIDTNSDNIAAINTFIGPDVAQSTLGAKLNGAEAGAVATVKNDLATMHILSKSGNNYTADVYTKSQTNDAINSATASMATTDDLQRSMGLVYTKTEADSRTNQLISEAGLVSENEFTAASVVAKVNNAGSEVSINADKINLQGQTNFETAIGNMISAQTLTVSDVYGQVQTILSGGNATFSGNVVASQFLAGDPNGLNITMSDKSISFNYGDDARAWFTPFDENDQLQQGMYLYIKNPSSTGTNQLITIDFANLKFKNSQASDPVHTIYITKITKDGNLPKRETVTKYYKTVDGVTTYYDNSECTITLTYPGDSWYMLDNSYDVILYNPYADFDTSRYYFVKLMRYRNVQFTSGVMKDTGRYVSITTDLWYGSSAGVFVSLYGRESIYNPNDTITIGSSGIPLSRNGETGYMFASNNTINVYCVQKELGIADVSGVVSTFIPYGDSTGTYLGQTDIEI